MDFIGIRWISLESNGLGFIICHWLGLGGVKKCKTPFFSRQRQPWVWDIFEIKLRYIWVEWKSATNIFLSAKSALSLTHCSSDSAVFAFTTFQDARDSSSSCTNHCQDGKGQDGKGELTTFQDSSSSCITHWVCQQKLPTEIYNYKA